MVTYKSITIQLCTIILAFSSGLALAAEGAASSSSISMWPLIVLIALLVVFRKKFISEATPEASDVEHQDSSTTETVAEKAAPAEAVVEKAEPKAKAKPKAKVKPKAKPKAKTSSNIIDLNDDSNQCQAGTSKGTRCKRTTTLEKTSIKVDNITYQLTVCSQHNNDKLKPFSGLIKK